MSLGTPEMSPVTTMIFAIVWLFFILGMAIGYVVMLIVWWRTMKAHQKIADKLSEIADKFQPK
jgi:uncharacterized membrane-anchored protein YhcB (DUF1043 family)